MAEDRGTRVYVGNLIDSVKKEDLEMEFNKYGKINSVWVALNPPGFAFVEFANKQDAESACDTLNGQECLGSTLKVEISRPRRPNNRFGGGNRFNSGGGRFAGAGGFSSGPRYAQGGGSRFGGQGRSFGGRRDEFGNGSSGGFGASTGGFSGGRYASGGRSRSPQSGPRRF